MYVSLYGLALDVYDIVILLQQQKSVYVKILCTLGFFLFCKCRVPV